MRALSAGLAVILLALVPAQAFAQSIFVAPELSARIAPAKAEYDAASAAEQSARAQLTEAETAVEEAQSALDAAWQQVYEKAGAKQAEEEQAKAALEKAGETLSAANEQAIALAPRRGEEPSQESQAADEALSQAQSAFFAAEQALKRIEARPGPLPPLTEPLALTVALARHADAMAKLREAEDRLATAFGLYVDALMFVPPPYLAEVAVTSGGTTHYQAKWVPAEGLANGASPAELDKLKEIRARLERDLAEMDEAAATLQGERVDLAERIGRLSDAANEFGATASNQRYYAIYAQIAIDSVAAAIDVFTTGGSATAATLLAEKVLPAATGKIGAFVALEAGGNEVLVDPVSDATGDEIAPGILTSDLIELAISTATPDGSTLQPITSAAAEGGWLSLSTGRAALGKAVNVRGFATNVAKGAPVAFIASFAKVAATKYFEGQLERANQQAFEIDLQIQMTLKMLDALRAMHAPLLDQRRKYRIALADVDYRLKLGRNGLKLQKTADTVVPNSKDGDGGIVAALRFNVALDQPPEVILSAPGKSQVLAVSRADREGLAWRASLATLPDLETETAFDLIVKPGSGTRPYPQLDSNPATIPTLRGTAEWNFYEKGIDENHAVRIAARDPDPFALDGLWDIEGGVVRFRQLGSSLTSTYVKTAGRFAFDPGAPNLDVVVEGNRITGRVALRVPRELYASCPQDFWVNVEGTISDDGKTINTVRDNIRVVGRPGNCRSIVEGSVREVYRRVEESEQPETRSTIR